MPIEILQIGKRLEACERSLAEHFIVHRLHDAADKNALLAGIGDRVRGVAGSPVDGALMERLPRLEIIANFGVGYDSIDVDAARARNIRVTNTPNVLNDAVAELAIGLMVALARRIPQADQFVRGRRWPNEKFPLLGELNGRTVGIVGLGRIGREIATRAQAMKMRVVYHGRHRQPNEPFVYFDNLLNMAREVDWLVIIAPGGPATDRLVTRDVLTALGPQGYLVNVARGSLIDEPAMVRMLLEGELGGAALDVFENEPDVPHALLALDNVVLSPHQGSGTKQTRDLMGALMVRNLVAHFSGEPLVSPIA